ncbi:polysaccharide biosynthesis protein [Lachnospiraceae bacterium DSM 108991]|uniref:Polysaccharide biosynthesis protein n=1 Tax=Claveliimonas monacensis TaxID=2779351 RepID=A0ABR9RKG5_9FIRM|nr:oligosaccharide flippase family protein [Claveliimonas monacensis]MBE5063451.1 polysaccharide biosynthesis protein [Claveliimonas monacensis]
MIKKNISIEQYALVIAFGLCGNFLIDALFAIKDGWRYKPCFQVRNKEVIEMFKLFLPIVYSSGVYKFSLMVDSIIASRLDTGKLTVLNYSNQVAYMVNTIFIGNLLLYCYPKIVAKIEEKGNQKVFWNQVGLFHLIVCMIIAGFVSVGHEGITVLFQHGKFGSDASNAVFIGSLIYITGQQINIVRDLIYRYFYAKGDTKTPAGNSILVSITNILLSIILVRIIGFYGIALGTVGASLLSLVVITINFKRKIGLEISLIRVIEPLVKNIIVMSITVIVIILSKIYWPIDNSFLAILIYGCETVAIFIFISLLFNREILKTFKVL